MKQNTDAEIRQTNITVDLGGMPLHPVLILGRVRRTLREAGYAAEWIDRALDEAVSGDDEHMVDTLMAMVKLKM